MKEASRLLAMDDKANSADYFEHAWFAYFGIQGLIKTDQGQGSAQRIVARNCVLWNEVARALSIGAELRQDVDDVLFTKPGLHGDAGGNILLAHAFSRPRSPDDR